MSSLKYTFRSAKSVGGFSNYDVVFSVRSPAEASLAVKHLSSLTDTEAFLKQLKKAEKGDFSYAPVGAIELKSSV